MIPTTAGFEPTTPKGYDFQRDSRRILVIRFNHSATLPCVCLTRIWIQILRHREPVGAGKRVPVIPRVWWLLLSTPTPPPVSRNHSICGGGIPIGAALMSNENAVQERSNLSDHLAIPTGGRFRGKRTSAVQSSDRQFSLSGDQSRRIVPCLTTLRD